MIHALAQLMRRAAQRLSPIAAAKPAFDITASDSRAALIRAQERLAQAHRLSKRNAQDTFRITAQGFFLGDRKWEHGMRMPGTNELISAAINYGKGVE